ncbi:hypothetical protein GN316_08615 [Xylophilus sp. Kf1]|nr:hypothetical protein [Xylophilus sp. Kf1]
MQHCTGEIETEKHRVRRADGAPAVSPSAPSATPVPPRRGRAVPASPAAADRAESPGSGRPSLDACRLRHPATLTRLRTESPCNPPTLPAS